jgi:hypothetical protein
MLNTDEQIGVILNEYLMTDDEPTERKGYVLRRKYEDASDDEKKLIDKLMIIICGYSLKTIIEEAQNECEVWVVVDINGKKIGEFINKEDAEEYANERVDEECSVQKGGNHEW